MIASRQGNPPQVPHARLSNKSKLEGGDNICNNRAL